MSFRAPPLFSDRTTNKSSASHPKVVLNTERVYGNRYLLFRGPHRPARFYIPALETRILLVQLLMAEYDLETIPTSAFEPGTFPGERYERIHFGYSIRDEIHHFLLSGQRDIPERCKRGPTEASCRKRMSRFVTIATTAYKLANGVLLFYHGYRASGKDKIDEADVNIGKEFKGWGVVPTAQSALDLICFSHAKDHIGRRRMETSILGAGYVIPNLRKKLEQGAIHPGVREEVKSIALYGRKGP